MLTVLGKWRCEKKFNTQVLALLIAADTGIEQLREAEKSDQQVLHKPLNPSRLRALIATAGRDRTRAV